MTRYLLSVHTSGESSAKPMSPEQMQRGFEQIAQLEQEMTEAGALVLSVRLEPADAAVVVRSRRGRVHATDGPFLETKEVVGGFYVIEAPDREAAIGWASKTSDAIGMPIELRPFLAWH